MLHSHQVHHLPVDQRLGLRGAGQCGVSAQILVGHGLHGHHVEVIAHAVAGDHGSRQPGRLLDIIAGAGGDRAECHFLGGSSAGQGGNLILQLFLVHQVVIALLHLHGVAESAGGSGNDGDLLHRCGVGLLCRHQGMSDLVVGHNQLFLGGEDRVLLLITGDNHLDGLFQVRLGGELSAVPDCPERSLIDNVGQLRAGGAGGHAGNLREIHVVRNLDLLCVYLQDILTAL